MEYRTDVEKWFSFIHSTAEKETDIKKIEDCIELGQIEEVIEMAKNEMTLIDYYFGKALLLLPPCTLCSPALACSLGLCALPVCGGADGTAAFGGLWCVALTLLMWLWEWVVGMSSTTAPLARTALRAGSSSPTSFPLPLPPHLH